MKLYSLARTVRGVCAFSLTHDLHAVAAVEVCATAIPTVFQTSSIVGGLLVVSYASCAAPLVLDVLERPWRKLLVAELFFFFLWGLYQSLVSP